MVIPDSVTEIGREAFYGCYWTDPMTGKKTGLTSITLPKNLTKLGKNSFYGEEFGDCQALATVKFTGTALAEIPRGTFSGTAITSITIPEGVTKIQGGFPSSLTSVTLPSTLIEIGPSAFGNTKLKTIVIPDSVTTIGDQAFIDCKELTSVTLGAGIKYIGHSAFRDCSVLAAVTIPDSVTAIKGGGYDIDSDAMIYVFEEGAFSYGSFEGCGKLGIAMQAAIKRRGYKGSF